MRSLSAAEQRNTQCNLAGHRTDGGLPELRPAVAICRLLCRRRWLAMVQSARYLKAGIVAGSRAPNGAVQPAAGCPIPKRERRHPEAA